MGSQPLFQSSANKKAQECRKHLLGDVPHIRICGNAKLSIINHNTATIRKQNSLGDQGRLSFKIYEPAGKLRKRDLRLYVVDVSCAGLFGYLHSCLSIEPVVFIVCILKGRFIKEIKWRYRCLWDVAWETPKKTLSSLLSLDNCQTLQRAGYLTHHITWGPFVR